MGTGAEVDRSTGTGSEADSAPCQGRVEHYCRPRRSECSLSLNTGLDKSEDNELSEGLGTGAQSRMASKWYPGKWVREMASVSGQAVATASCNGWGPDPSRDTKEATIRPPGVGH